MGGAEDYFAKVELVKSSLSSFIQPWTRVVFEFIVLMDIVLLRNKSSVCKSPGLSFLNCP